MSVNEKMAAIADAIREKTETTDLLTLDGMAAAIAGLEKGNKYGVIYGTFTPTKNATTDTEIHYELQIAGKVRICVLRLSNTSALKNAETSKIGAAYLQQTIDKNMSVDYEGEGLYIQNGLTKYSDTTTGISTRFELIDGFGNATIKDIFSYGATNNQLMTVIRLSFNSNGSKIEFCDYMRRATETGSLYNNNASLIVGEEYNYIIVYEK